MDGAIEAVAIALNKFHHGPALQWDEASEAMKTMFRREAEAAIAAYGLTSETCCEGTYRDQEETGKYNVYTCADSGQSCRTRLVGPWSTR